MEVIRAPIKGISMDFFRNFADEKMKLPRFNYPMNLKALITRKSLENLWYLMRTKQLHSKQIQQTNKE